MRGDWKSMPKRNVPKKPTAASKANSSSTSRARGMRPAITSGKGKKKGLRRRGY